jgi:hypothetical protein
VTKVKRWSARLQGSSPSSQLSFQNIALAPLPTVMEVVAWKNKHSSLLHGTYRPCQGFGSFVHSCQSQQSLSARPNFSRSRTPSLHKSLGLLIVVQLTRQWPPFALSSPFQRKNRRILSICFLSHFARGKMDI